MTTNPRQRRLRKFWASDPQPRPGNMPPAADDERERLNRAARPLPPETVAEAFPEPKEPEK